MGGWVGWSACGLMCPLFLLLLLFLLPQASSSAFKPNPPTHPPTHPPKPTKTHSRLTELEKKHLAQAKTKLQGSKETNPEEKLKLIEDKEITVRPTHPPTHPPTPLLHPPIPTRTIRPVAHSNRLLSLSPPNPPKPTHLNHPPTKQQGEITNLRSLIMTKQREKVDVSNQVRLSTHPPTHQPTHPKKTLSPHPPTHSKPTVAHSNRPVLLYLPST